MRAITAENSLSFKIIIPEFSQSRAYKASMIERYVRRYSAQLKPSIALDEQKVRILRPTNPTPAWLNSVERRIRRSIACSKNEADDLGSGRWLTFEVAEAATAFYDSSADLLPGEPYIYASHDGDLVSEFDGKHGTLTVVVSPTVIILFANVGGVPVEQSIRYKEVPAAVLRAAVRDVSEMIRTGQHGKVDASK